jgi:hypothetical protein
MEMEKKFVECMSDGRSCLQCNGNKCDNRLDYRVQQRWVSGSNLYGGERTTKPYVTKSLPLICCDKLPNPAGMISYVPSLPSHMLHTHRIRPL